MPGPRREKGILMSVKIGHASIDEHGRAAGGTAGNQTARELCTRSWWNDGWSVVLRPASALAAEKIASTCEAACANPHIGYDQGQRLTLAQQAAAVGYNVAAITTPCECDCSALANVCCLAAGIHVSASLRTATMLTAYRATGAFEVLSGLKYTRGENCLRRGDILLAPGKHTAIVLSNGNKAIAEAVAVYKAPLPTLRRGSRGTGVKQLQAALNHLGYSCGTADGVFGEATAAGVSAFQRARGLSADGIYGIKTAAALAGAL